MARARQVKAAHIKIRGRVQGVGFRYFAERRASELNVVGFVRNLPEGEVEVLAQADSVVLESFCLSLREGPSFARVEDLRIEDVPVDPDLRDFRVRY